MRKVIMLPVRLASTRVPRKALRSVDGQPLIRRVVEEVKALGLGLEPIVVTDSEEVVDVVGPHAVTVLTSTTPRNGTERIAEALGCFRDIGLVVNIQADQLGLYGKRIQQAIDMLEFGGWDVTTLARPAPEMWPDDPNQVKVLLSDHGTQCLDFARHRSALSVGRFIGIHVGVYVYRPEAIERWVALPMHEDEEGSGLEQLRPLRHGMRFGAVYGLMSGLREFNVEEDFA